MVWGQAKLHTSAGEGLEKPHTFPTGTSVLQDHPRPSSASKGGIACSWQELFPRKPWEPGWTQSEGAKGRESGSVPSCTDGLSGSCCWPWWSLSMISLFDTKPSSLTAPGSLALWDALPGVTPCTHGLRCSQQERLRASPALLAGSCPCGTWGQGKGGKEGKEGKEVISAHLATAEEQNSSWGKRGCTALPDTPKNRRRAGPCSQDHVLLRECTFPSCSREPHPYSPDKWEQFCL